MAVAGVSTLGITVGYGVEETAGTKPTKFTQLTRINSIGEVTNDSEQIDVSAIEDFTSRYVAGRMDTGGTWGIEVFLTPDTAQEWATLIGSYNTLKDGKRMWFEVIIPSFEKAFFVVAQPPTAIQLPEISGNSALTKTFNLVIEEAVGMDDKVTFTAGE